ncbi:MAG: hypothetical protein A2X35_02750 [Elusimicrobia bacterium GWA2_61_42]|nr:MAG: hypothetical protein A2X35_02750 [Elusimicrobia bacterium GWA2_61_42]OGR78064.1 MAG: hypothetical protein A2X38_01755 [Elusimicrobia bacterium GWC2_61_25]
MSGHLKNILTLLAVAVVSAPLLLACASWGRNLAPGLKTRLANKASTAPLIKEARRLGLTYEAALAAPSAAVGKPAVWCLRRAGSGPAAYRGDEARPVHIINPEKMPGRAGSGHESCTDALVEITTVTALSFGEVSALRLEARFVAYP